MTEREQIPHNQIKTSTIEKMGFPEGGDRRLNALLSAFNISPAAVTYLLVPDFRYITLTDLRDHFYDVFDGTKVVGFRPDALLRYCSKLSRTGLVSEHTENLGKEKLVEFTHTETGRKYGTIAACLGPYFEQQHQQSLYPVLGQASTNSPEQLRAPYTRARILLLLDKRPKLSRAEVCKELDIDEVTVGQNLEALAKAGAINYEAVTLHTGKTQVSYSGSELLVSEAIGHENGRSTFEQEVKRCCEKLVGEAITQEAIFRTLPQEIRDRYKNERNLRNLINKTLSDLSSKLYLQRGKFKGKEVQSVARISERGKTIVKDFLSPLIVLAQDDDVEREWLKIVPQVKENLKFYAQNSAKLYYPHSKSFKMRQNQENIARLNGILSDNSEELTASELSDQLGLSRRTIYSYLASMTSKIQREKRKGVYYYRAKPNE